MTSFSSWTEEQLAYISLTQVPGFGCKRLQQLYDTCGSWKAAWAAPYKQLCRSGIPETFLERYCDWRHGFDVASVLSSWQQQEIAILLPDDGAFPRPLAQSADPPTILFVRGTLQPAPSLAIVGTRKPTAYGTRCVDMLIPPLCEAGFVTVSGLALGIDGHVHGRTIACCGTTIAFVGSGVDDASIYPSSHLTLAHAILENGGAIVSELAPGSKSRREYFPQRNRLIAWYASATLVVEATKDSGSLITAKLALEENREVFAVPGPIWSEQSWGTNNLIRMGAQVCTQAQDIFDGLHLDRPDLVAKTQAAFPLDPTETHLLEALTEPLHQDELGQRLEISAAALSSMLTILELKGCVACLGGNTWVKTRLPTV